MKPYKFEPYLKTTIWGGYRIAPFKGIYTAQPNIGESWEISGVPGHESDVGAKIYAGQKKGITPEDYERMATAEPVGGRSPMQNVIATHEAHQGDLFFLSAGKTLTAIRANCTLQRHATP